MLKTDAGTFLNIMLKTSALANADVFNNVVLILIALGWYKKKKNLRSYLESGSY